MLLDSNLIIYASRPKHSALRTFIAREAPSVSAVSEVETLGYHDLTEKEKQFLEEFFDAAIVFPVSQSVITEAIQLLPGPNLFGLVYSLRTECHNFSQMGSP